MMIFLERFAKAITPAWIPRQLRRWKHRRRATDLEAAWQIRREFFWKAFKAFDYNGISGDYVEFGSHGGMTFRLAFDQISARKIKRRMWAFDSFCGLPEASAPADDHPHWKKGGLATSVEAFHRICRVHGMKRDAYSTVEGFYDETLTKLADTDAPVDIALAYIDCDMYSSTKTVLDFLLPRLKHGMIVAFDDYYCWSADQISGERRALLEFLEANTEWRFLQYRDFGWAGESFVVERAEQTLTE